MKTFQGHALIALLAASPLAIHARPGGGTRGSRQSQAGGISFEPQGGTPMNRGSVFGGDRGDRSHPDGDSFFGGHLPGFDIDIELTDITCAAEFACGKDDDDDDVSSVFVCRGLFDPMTGIEKNRTVCIEPDEAWSTDECGCCGEDCPQKPDFIDITCDEEDEDVVFPDLDFDDVFKRGNGRRGDDFDGFGHEDRNFTVVCRTLYNPFNGTEINVTIPIPTDKALEGDTCGCCDGVCPQRGDDKPFSRPDEVNKTCAAEELVSCDVRGKKHHRGREQDESEMGQFVCRTTYDIRTGMEEKEPVCISPDDAWESDDCGCCGEDCPASRRPVDIECPAEETETCDLRGRDREGLFVCRTIFNPLNGTEEQVSLCIPSDRAWETDDCGCCTASGCPVAPAEGFEDEDTQMAVMALSTSDETTEAAALTDNSGAVTIRSIAFLAGSVGAASLAAILVAW